TAHSPELDSKLLPSEIGLSDLPELPATTEGAQRMANGNSGMVIAANAEYGELAWASHLGKPIAVGVYKAGELHPTRVFRL
ncbi:MAG: tRNA pseudouridine(55) synthase TruB, partial [Boseongicola sp.]